MARHLEAMVHEAITTRADHLVTAIQSANEPVPEGNALTVPPLDTFEAPEVYVQILTPEGTVLARSSNLEGQSLPLPQGPLKRGDFPASLGSVRMRALLDPITAGGRNIAWVQVAASYREKERVLGRLRWTLVTGGLGTVAAVGLLGGALAGRALRPVSEMAETARAIALSRGFSRRLGVSNPKDELGQLAQTFNEMLASLEEAYAAQQRFTADASHELRAPLTAIRGNLDLLDRIRDMPEGERREALAQVRREVERLSRLVNDLLALARADAGQALVIRQVELDALLVDAHRQARSIAKGVSVRLGHLEPALVQGDEDRLKELLVILLDNALRYTPEGGSVTLSLNHEPPWVTVCVEDTGIGIEQKDLPHIFDRFWRADRARSRDSGGTGLGLAIAKWIVEQHGGEVLVASGPGQGTRFSVRLPAAPSAPPQ
ncbi:MAG: HAMP domain-containing histidine kinase [Chloroflexi bacterium]|nr:HAMP domain-containing histidine kinase [Chloroflexota bacterium]